MVDPKRLDRGHAGQHQAEGDTCEPPPLGVHGGSSLVLRPIGRQGCHLENLTFALNHFPSHQALPNLIHPKVVTERYLDGLDLKPSEERVTVLQLKPSVNLSNSTFSD